MISIYHRIDWGPCHGPPGKNDGEYVQRHKAMHRAQRTRQKALWDGITDMMKKKKMMMMMGAVSSAIKQANLPKLFQSLIF